MVVDFSKLKKLREETDVSFSLCKKALEESDNDLKKARLLLQEWGGKKASEKSDRETGEGGIFNYIHHNKKIASLLELASETDFVSGNEDFQKLGNELAMQAASVKAKDLEDFLDQEYIRDSSKKVSDLIKEAVLKFGENIKVIRFVRWEFARSN